MKNVTFYLFDLMRRFHDEDEGLALSEYLVVLGLLIGGVIGAVLIFGQNLATAWGNWSTWVLNNLGNAPT